MQLIQIHILIPYQLHGVSAGVFHDMLKLLREYWIILTPCTPETFCALLVYIFGDPLLTSVYGPTELQQLFPKHTIRWVNIRINVHNLCLFC